MEGKDTPSHQHGSWLTAMLAKSHQRSVEDEDCSHDSDKPPCWHSTDARDSPNRNQRKDERQIPQLQQTRITCARTKFTQPSEPSCKVEGRLTLTEIDVQLLNDQHEHPRSNMLFIQYDRNEVV